jgi:membrane protein YqaA with SNARE-associated domain
MPRPVSALWRAVERFAHARGAVPATFLWNLGQGSVVPGPVELLFLPLAVAEPRKAWTLAAAAATGSVLGGCLAFGLGSSMFAAIGQPVLAAIGVSGDALTDAMGLMARYGWVFVLGSTLTPISTKAVAVAAGATGMAFPAFVAALAAGRVARFSAMVLVLRASSGLLLRLRQRLLRP